MQAENIERASTEVGIRGSNLNRACHAHSGHFPILVVLAVLVAFFLSSYFYTGYYASDDLTYLSSVIALANGSNLAPDLASLRFPVTVPAAIIYKLTAGSVFYTIYSFVAYHLILVFLAYILAKRFLDPWLAILVSWVVALSPIFYVFAGSLLPDNCLATWIMLWLLCLTPFLRYGRNLEDFSARKLYLWLFVAGVINGIAYSAKESGLILIVPFAAALPLYARRWLSPRVIGSFIIYLSGLLVFLAIETLVIHSLTGQWLFRLGIISNDVYTTHLTELVARQGTYPLERFAFLLALLREFYTTQALILIAATLLLHVVLPRRELFLWGVSVWFVVYQTIGTTSFSQYVPPPLVHRYYAVVWIPIIILCFRTYQQIFAWLVEKLALNRIRYLHAGMTCLGLAACLVWGGRLLQKNADDAGLIYRAAHVKSFITAYNEARRAYPDTPIVLSGYSSRRMHPFFPVMPDQVYFGDFRINRNQGQLPALPIIYIEAEEAYESTGSDALSDGYKDFKKILVNKFYPPTSRWQEIRNNNAAIFNVLEPDTSRKDPRFAYSIYLVTPADSSSASSTQVKAAKNQSNSE